MKESSRKSVRSQTTNRNASSKLSTKQDGVAKFGTKKTSNNIKIHRSTIEVERPKLKKHSKKVSRTGDERRSEAASRDKVIFRKSNSFGEFPV